MAVQLINVGNVANDGTGDDLREAMIKINQNFEELDLRDDEQTTVTNLGTVGEGVFAQKLNYDLQLKKIAGSGKVTVASDLTTITISTDIGLDTLTVTANTGSVELDNVANLAIEGGDGITTVITDNTLTITNDYVADLVEDLTPQLGGNLDAQGFNILNAGTINASSVTGAFTGSLTGLVYGYDIRDWAQWNTGWDFGAVSEDYTSAIQFIVANTDVDFGTFGAPAVGNVDLGSI
jgi:hypothetical protein